MRIDIVVKQTPMLTTVTSLPKSTLELSIELSPEEMRPYLNKAAEAVSREHPLPGFRPGKVPYAIAAQHYGAMALWEEAADQAVRDAFVRAVREQSLQTIGQPRIEIKTLAPDNPIRFTATVAILPTVELPDFATISVKKHEVKITTEKIDRALDDLRKLQPKEARVERAAAATDKVVVDLELKDSGVPLEGGQARSHQIRLSEDYYLPAVREALIGLAPGATKTFPVTFPPDHFQKHLANKTVDCSVNIKEVYEVELPTLDDAFAQSMGQEDLAGLRSLVTKNLTEEAEHKATDAEDITLLDTIVAKATISELPDILITGEAHRMVDELERSITGHGLAFDEYLKKIGKTRDEVLIGFASEAVQRVKAALVTSTVAKQHKIAPDETEVDTTIAAERQRYKDTPEFQQRLGSEEARDYVRAMLRNRKVITWLRDQVRWAG
ncbi:MAG: trigger factor [Candidatus Uhrbacteria bacterium]